MKIIIFALFIYFSISYDTTTAIQYARKYCSYYGRYDDVPDEAANYVSKCLIAGGMKLSGCNGVYSIGTIPNGANLMTCLTQKGWKHSIGINKRFKPGYPFFSNNKHSMIATYVDGKSLRYCAHDNNRCDQKMNAPDNYFYYYL